MCGIIGILGEIDVSPRLQLLAYYVAAIKGTDIDQPRNLAKVWPWNKILNP